MVSQPTLGGQGNIDDNVINLPAGAFRATAVRTFDPKTGRWAIWWIDSRNPVDVGTPVVGGFENGVGTFYADEVVNGRAVRTRFLWTDVSTPSPRWEQAQSVDAGANWETNWTMRFQREQVMTTRGQWLLALAGPAFLSSVAAVFAQPAPKQEGPPMTASAKLSYAPINGLQLYYEVHGTGKPLIVLHGGIAASEALGPNLPLLAKTRQVVAVHLQGHGRTKDIDRPLRFETLADDVAALASHLGFSKVHIMGYSLGGGVAAQVAIRHPPIVERLVIVSVAMKRSGWHPEVLAAFDQMEAAAPQLGANVGQSPLAKLHPHVDWVKLFAKMGKLLKRDYDWSKEIAQIRAPTMLVFADADAQTPEHIMEFWGLLGGGKRDAGYDGSLRPTARLAIVPGTTHYNLFSTPVVAELVAPFLDAELPAAMRPLSPQSSRTRAPRTRLMRDW